MKVPTMSDHLVLLDDVRQGKERIFALVCEQPLRLALARMAHKAGHGIRKELI